jgi:hypothetical protein
MRFNWKFKIFGWHIDFNSICFSLFLLKLPKTTTAQPEIADAASPIGILAFYSVIIIGVTIAFIA